MGKTMRAAVPDGNGSVGIVTVPVPEPGADEVLVRVEAAGMNRADLLHANGKYAQAMRGASAADTAGMEFAGTVVAVGRDADPGLLGTGVMAMFPGAYAEYAAVPAALLLPAPCSLSPRECAALPMGLLTEFDALRSLARLGEGERVLVTGAASGVGLIGVQLAKLLGAGFVAAATRDPRNDALLTELGADVVPHDVAELPGLPGIDVVIDHVGGAWCEALAPVLADSARVVSVGRLGGRRAMLDLTAFSAKRATLMGTTWKTRGVAEVAACVRAVRAAGVTGVRAVIAGSHALSDITTAYRTLASERAAGKLLIIPQRTEEV
ncbi:hypothetical protein BAY61_11495 [Prauserella marina]|uniref:NADPH:quinone reductase n=1 Tax=Prauserella marina TaxID=530584 RepID=A0A222VNM6_9PSEU|nr:zinc-binding dehydrogenase [Prauserella marina]ASR35519.1 hypothetical protein BAY61_11495 [Prauserella marina]PWV84649.1 NADPH:quinone reductase-like Zn-dependent oxidoreductase [Prauserella marina]SDC16704.1 NADPH:quinone reductase [Prauserella marina]